MSNRNTMRATQREPVSLMQRLSRRNLLQGSGAALAAISLPLVIGNASAAQGTPDHEESNKPMIVLAHGAWADGNSWAKVISRLQDDDYTVVAPAVGLESLSGDIASVRKVIADLGVPVLVVGHSYGGAVITGAASGLANVKGLVYVAAYAPNTGDSTLILNTQFDTVYGPSNLGPALRPDGSLEDPHTHVYLDRAMFRDVFAQDVDREEAALMAATQRPPALAILGEPLSGTPAWSQFPTWYQVSKQDRVIQPDGQRWMAERCGAQVVELDASHVSLVSEPKAIAKLIKKAAKAVA